MHIRGPWLKIHVEQLSLFMQWLNVCALKNNILCQIGRNNGLHYVTILCNGN